MNEPHRVFSTVFVLCLCVVVACGDDDSSDSESEPENPHDYGSWMCFDYGNECFCHVSKRDESPSPTVRVVDKCEEFSCCVSYQDSYSARCDCRNIATECQFETEGKTNATVVPQCPP